MNHETTADLTSLGEVLHGDLCLPGSPGYAAATSPRNATARQQPAAVAAVASASDVATCVRIAAQAGLTVCVQATGHGAAGWVGPQTLLVDTSRLTEISIDPERRVARIGAGVTLGVLNDESARHGLLARTGTATSVGVAGYTFGGGVGWLARSHGLASASLLAVEFVDGNGERWRADSGHDTGALWAFRGGGGAGLATAVELALVPADQMWAGYVLWPARHAEAVITAWATMLGKADPDLATTIGILRLPDAPPVPEKLRGRPAVHLAAASIDGESGGRGLLDMLATVPAPAVSTLGPCDAGRLGTIHLDPPAATPALGEGQWLTADVPGHAADILCACGTGGDSPLAEVELRHVATRAEARVPGALTTCPGPFLLHAVGAAATPGEQRAVADGLETVRRAAAPAGTGRSAAAFRDGQTSAPGALDEAARARLRDVRARLDPDGRFTAPRPLA